MIFLPYVDKDLTSEFLRFSENFFTGGKSDKKHEPAIKSCLIRVPGTINSKNGDKVRIIKRWDSNYPNIKRVTSEFRIHLIQKRNDSISYKKKRNSISKSNTVYRYNKSNNYTIDWIETLLQTPLEDYRKICLWKILIPYLVNIKNLSDEEAFTILKNWLNICDHKRKLDFDPNVKIKAGLKYDKGYFPPSKETLKRNEGSNLFQLLVSKNVVSG